MFNTQSGSLRVLHRVGRRLKLFYTLQSYEGLAHVCLDAPVEDVRSNKVGRANWTGPHAERRHEQIMGRKKTGDHQRRKKMKTRKLEREKFNEAGR